MNKFWKTSRGPATTQNFPQGKKELKKMEELLQCVICGKLPNKVYSTGQCEHKYCGKCVNRLESICFICDTQIRKGDIKIDEFSTSLTAYVRMIWKSLS